MILQILKEETKHSLENKSKVVKLKFRERQGYYNPGNHFVCYLFWNKGCILSEYFSSQ